MKKIVKSIVLGLCMAAPMVSGAAPVTNTNLGTVVAGTPFGQTHTVADGVFSDGYDFSVIPNSNVAAALITVKLSGAGYINFTSGLLDGAVPLSVVVDNVNPLFGSVTATFGALTSGVAHRLVLGGNAVDGTASYNGNWQVVAPVTATPIPGAVWLFGSALVGLMGVSGRKKTLS
ncbi:MAG: hypothetical protein NTV00_08635 [Methylococcales bacterium]|nr:hypothetical protein [Methylococcales bacterium]